MIYTCVTELPLLGSEPGTCGAVQNTLVHALDVHTLTRGPFCKSMQLNVRNIDSTLTPKTAPRAVRGDTRRSYFSPPAASQLLKVWSKYFKLTPDYLCKLSAPNYGDAAGR